MEHVQQGRYADLYSPVRPFTPEERAKVEEQMQATYDAFVEKAAAGPQHDAREDRRDRPGPRLDRAAGEGSSGWSTSSAASSARSRSPRSAPRSPQDAGVELVVYPPRKSIYEIVAEPVRPVRRAAAALGALLGLEDPRALADADRAAAASSAAASRWR